MTGRPCGARAHESLSLPHHRTRPCLGSHNTHSTVFASVHVTRHFPSSCSLSLKLACATSNSRNTVTQDSAIRAAPFPAFSHDKDVHWSTDQARASADRRRGRSDAIMTRPSRMDNTRRGVIDKLPLMVPEGIKLSGTGTSCIVQTVYYTDWGQRASGRNRQEYGSDPSVYLFCSRPRSLLDPGR